MHPMRQRRTVFVRIPETKYCVKQLFIPALNKMRTVSSAEDDNENGGAGRIENCYIFIG